MIGERELGRMILEEWRLAGHRVREEPFACAPTSFLGFLPLLVPCYLLALFLDASSHHLAALAVEIVGLLLVACQLLLYWPLLDRFFPQQSGVNVVGVIRSAQPPKQRVVVSAHQDAAYEFNLWWLFRAAGVPAMILSIGCLLLPLLFFTLPRLWRHPADFFPADAGPVPPEEDAHLLLVVGLLCWPFAALNLMFHSGHIVPGAMDNLAGIAVLMGLSHALQTPAAPLLQHTEVVLLATSSEECGLRGAQAFAKAHGAEYGRRGGRAADGVITQGIFVDGIYDERHLTIVTRELTTGAVHDRELIRRAEAAARQWQAPYELAVIPFGASDAAAFSVSGIPSVSILCQDTHRLVHNYHTRDDTQDLVRPQSLTTTLKVVYAMISQMDQEMILHQSS